ncbi:hypothetical protein BDY21DRAFT_320173 [Lineolata rhizophorae]|uniref:non-specific serine/threonine protein kinase n=1 Tax=Lineolata rhizophorae TaxID=578093 RepID=A0A6A6P1M3_9PEZI|nr:hypothetical protein BDY21DRAFT_320173 [Lineolata rhizophorae]
MANRVTTLAQQEAGAVGDMPLSTIAAQIVSNHSNVASRRDAGDKNLFRQLLHEFLSDPAADEPDIEVNSKLILVVGEAGLDVLANDDPFALDILIPQAVDSLSVIKLTIRRKPELLFYTSRSEAGLPSQPPLLLWLFPKLLRLLGRARLRRLESHVADVLELFVHVLALSRHKWRDTVPILLLYKTCIEDIIHALRESRKYSLTSAGFNLVLPSSAGISSISPVSQQLMTLSRSSQVDIKCSDHATTVALILLGSVSDPISGPLASTVEQYRTWGVQQLHEITELSIGRRNPLSRTSVPIKVILDILNVLKRLNAFQESAQLSHVHRIKSVSVVTTVCQCLFKAAYAVSPLDNTQEVADALSHNLLGLLNGVHHCDWAGRVAMEHLGPIIHGAVRESLSAFLSMNADLQSTICLWLDFLDPKHNQVYSPEIMQKSEGMISAASQFESESLSRLASTLPRLSAKFKALECSGERPSKRPKLDDHVPTGLGGLSGPREKFDGVLSNIKRVHTTEASPESSYSFFCDAVCYKLRIKSSGSLEPILEELKVWCENHSDGDPYDLLMLFSKLPCIVAGAQKAVEFSGRLVSWGYCTLCDTANHNTGTPPLYWEDDIPKESPHRTIRFLEEIITTTRIKLTRSFRAAIGVVVGRMVQHINDSESLNLSQSAFGTWCIKSLRSSVKDVRHYASLAFPLFLRDDLSEDLRKHNRVVALNILQNLTDRNSLTLQPTVIHAWCSVGKVCGDDELNLALLTLVRYLRHSQPFICGVAYQSILRLARSKGISPDELFRPFWKNIAITVVQDIFSRPQLIQTLSELLGKSVNQFLVQTQTDTLPYLVLMKKRNILERLAAARGPSVSILDLCMTPSKNRAATLARLLQHDPKDFENTAREFLCGAAEAPNDLDIASLVKSEPIQIACELLKSAAEVEVSKRSHIYQAIQSLAVIEQRKPGLKSNPKPSKLLAGFFEAHVLGIMTYFSEVIDNRAETYNLQPMFERKRCLRALEQMILMAKNKVTIALPQIRACLQAAVDANELLNSAFPTWIALVTSVDEDDLGVLLDHVFSIIAQKWSLLSTENQSSVQSMLDYLLKNHQSLVRDRFPTIPAVHGIPLLSKFDAQMSKMKEQTEIPERFEAFSVRCKDENAVVVAQALHELLPYLQSNQQFLHESAVGQQPNPVIPQLIRSLLDASVRFSEKHSDISNLCADCLGIIGSVDPYRVETIREKRDILVLSNFERADDVIDFVASFLETVLVHAFRSETNPRNQGFLSYAMQELMKHTGFNNLVAYGSRSSVATDSCARRWEEIPDSIRSTLTPFANSKYTVAVNSARASAQQNFPIYSRGMSHSTWLRTFVLALLQRGKGDNPQMVFPVLSRIIRTHDISIPKFLLPFVALNVLLGGAEDEMASVRNELLLVLKEDMVGLAHDQAIALKHCSEDVFQVLDYISRWFQEKKKSVAELKAQGVTRNSIAASEIDEMKDVQQMSCVEAVLGYFPAEISSSRAIECGSYSRALLYWEQFIRQEKEKKERLGEKLDQEPLYQRLQEIYAQIDDPDCLEGISAHVHVLDPEQQLLEHRKAGRWITAQSWYEQLLAEKADDPELQVNLLTCLKESGQYNSLLNYVESFQNGPVACLPRILPFAAEAAWVTNKWDTLEKFLSKSKAHDHPTRQTSLNFNVGIGCALLSLKQNDKRGFASSIDSLRQGIAKQLVATNTDSMQACHDQLLKLHVLYEVEALSGMSPSKEPRVSTSAEMLNRRLDILGTFLSDKQYLLGVRRAVMQLSLLPFGSFHKASSWLASSKLARKANFNNTAYNAVFHAARLGDDASKLEQSRLLWKDGHSRKAIQTLEGAIVGNSFQAQGSSSRRATSMDGELQHQQNMLVARAHLLLARWLDAAGQTQSTTLTTKYQEAARPCRTWNKPHYYLGKFYNKLLDSQKGLELAKQTPAFTSGDLAKLVVENYLRSMQNGAKYLYQSLPKLITLWLDLGVDIQSGTHGGRPATRETIIAKTRSLDAMHTQIRKYADKLPTYYFYTALPQILTRISHPNPRVTELLLHLVIKVASSYPRQSLWRVLAVPRSKAHDRKTRGWTILNKLKETPKKSKGDGSQVDLRNLINHGQKLTEALLYVCEAWTPQSRRVSLTGELGFNAKLAPCNLVVPMESTLIATLPATQSGSAVKSHNPFSSGVVTISSFNDEVLILRSLARPRKLTIRGSDGQLYGLLCKPKDDLRKDQRLMEFNALINRALRDDVEASKRRLFVKTYAVTPLDEECGAIEWVDGLKPMREAILEYYRRRGRMLDWDKIRDTMTEACKDEENLPLFTELCREYPPVVYEWFLETFPQPESWFAGRLRYTRTSAVMSIVGHSLGLGDRHPENISLEETTGSVVHVDFNCLFEKGLTFAKPETVPFRLTRHMVDAFGPSGVEGPFRNAAEIVLRILRANYDPLSTILETFVHDPTTDFIGRRGRRKIVGLAANLGPVPDTPQEVLDSFKAKLTGLLGGESVPLSVEGYVEELIKLATDEWRLCNMYWGWCPFL